MYFTMYFLNIASFQMFQRMKCGECWWRFHPGTDLVFISIVDMFNTENSAMVN